MPIFGEFRCNVRLRARVVGHASRKTAACKSDVCGDESSSLLARSASSLGDARYTNLELTSFHSPRPWSTAPSLAPRLPGKLGRAGKPGRACTRRLCARAAFRCVGTAKRNHVDDDSERRGACGGRSSTLPYSPLRDLVPLE